MRRTKIEQHPDRAAIEMDLIRGLSVRKVSARYGVSKDAAQRYRDSMPPGLSAKYLVDILKPGADVDEIASELKRGRVHVMARTLVRLMHLMDVASDGDDIAAAARVAGEITRILRFQAEAEGDISRVSVVHNSINVLSINPEFVQFRDFLLGLCREYPDVRQPIIEHLHSLENANVASLPAPMIEGVAHAA